MWTHCQGHVEKDSLFGLLSREFSIILELKYDDIRLDLIESGYYKVTENRNMGITTLDGTEIIPTKYDYIYYYGISDTFEVCNGGFSGLFNTDGTLILEVAYKNIEYVDTNMIVELK